MKREMEWYTAMLDIYSSVTVIRLPAIAINPFELFRYHLYVIDTVF